MYFMESGSWECVNPKCLHRVDRARTKLKAGDACPKCVGGTLDVHFYHLDLAKLFPVGKCDCPDFDKSPVERRKRAWLQAIGKSGREALGFEDQERARCKHIKAARNDALNNSIAGHEAARLAGKPAESEDRT